MRPFTLSAVVWLCAGLAGPEAARAQDVPYDAVVERFFRTVQAGRTDEAVDDLYASNPWMKQSADAVERVRAGLRGLPPMMGQLRHYERLQTKTLGTRFVYVSYLAAYDRQPMRFVFEFYRPADEWITFGFLFDDELDEDVEQNARRELASDEEG